MERIHVACMWKKIFHKSLVPSGAVRDTLADEIIHDCPQWNAESIFAIMTNEIPYDLCVHAQLQSEKGDLTKLEHEVVDSLRDHELLTQKCGY